MTISTNTALEKLRLVLQELPPTGGDGFEGLVAACLADISGLTIRLAKSGSQFGRDASSTPAPFAIAMEAKRYEGPLRLEDLAGKVVVSGLVLNDKVDLWILGATSEVGDDTLIKVTDLLENYGVALVALDWASRPLPPLAVLLALAKLATASWFKVHAPTLDVGAITSYLTAIAGDQAFNAQADTVRQLLHPAHVGLDALRRRSNEWLRERLGERWLSQQTFGQFITVSSADSAGVDRVALSQALEAVAAIDPSVVKIVAVLGDEGIGKTWLVAQWWAQMAEPPIFIFVSGRRIRHLNVSEPLESIARLLAEQDGTHSEAIINQWRRRLLRWKGQGWNDRMRFVLVLDGLNEHLRTPWAEIIASHAREIHALGGLLIATSREAFWTREVAPRLSPDVALSKLAVTGYSDEELDVLAARAHASLTDISPQLREFIRNPRVFRVAASLLARLSLQVKDLTIERLLLEYWQSRIEERGSLLTHNIEDFHKLLRSHAKAWLVRPRRVFDRDDWSDYSGAAKRLGVQAVANDLTEIEEGRFLTVTNKGSSDYEFRPEALPFAIGLLINSELRESLETAPSDASETVARIIEPVRGFDIISEIVAAAVGLACLDASFPTVGRMALISTWLSLQNINRQSFQSMASWVPERPDAFLDALDDANGPNPAPTALGVLQQLLLACRDNPKVTSVLAPRVTNWLGRWSRQGDVLHGDDRQAARQDEREDRISKKLGLLSPSEAKAFTEVTTESAQPDRLRLDRIAAHLLAGRPLSPFASAFFAWALAHSVAADYYDAREELEWTIRLNTIDSAELEETGRALVRDIGKESSEPFRMAAAMLLRIVGDAESAAIAEGLRERGSGQTFRSVSRYCETNPHDPGVEAGSNLVNAVGRAELLQAVTLWNHLGVTSEDHDLELLSPALARFDPAPLVSLIRRIISTMPVRTGGALRQLAWRLIELSPLFNAECVAIIRDSYNKLIEDPNRVAQQDLDWVAATIVCAVNPHLSAEEQIELILKLPHSCPLFYMIRRAAKPLPTQLLQTLLERVSSENDTKALTRILFFSAVTKPGLTERVRLIVEDALNTPDIDLLNTAAAFVCAAEDTNLDAVMIDKAKDRRRKATRPRELFWFEQATAVAIVRRPQVEDVQLLSPEFAGWAALSRGGDFLDLFAMYTEMAVKRLLQPLSTSAVPDPVSSLTSTGDRFERPLWRRNDSRGSENRLIEELQNPELAVTRDEERHREWAELLADYEKRLAAEGAEVLVSIPNLEELRELARNYPGRVREWLLSIDASAEVVNLGQVRTLGLSLASAYSSHDELIAFRVMRLLRFAKPSINLLLGAARIEVYEYSVFSAAEGAEADKSRRELFGEAFDDGTLESLTVAAETCGAGDWLHRFVQDLILGTTREKATAITVAGFLRRNTLSDEMLGTSWGTGFLGDVAQFARENYDRASWAEHWITEALTSEDPVDFWRYCLLAGGVADARYEDVSEKVKSGPLVAAFGSEFEKQLQGASEKRSKKRKDTLFGLRKPDSDLVSALRSPS